MMGRVYFILPHPYFNTSTGTTHLSMSSYSGEAYHHKFFVNNEKFCEYCTVNDTFLYPHVYYTTHHSEAEVVWYLSFKHD